PLFCRPCGVRSVVAPSSCRGLSHFTDHQLIRLPFSKLLSAILAALALYQVKRPLMHADDTNYTVIKNGVVVVSGTGPAIRVDGNKLIIRDGPQETPPLALTRAEASRRLRHIIMCGHYGGFITFDALRWLRDTCVAFSQLDY